MMNPFNYLLILFATLAHSQLSTERLNVTCTFYGTKIKLTQSEPFTGVMYINKDRKNICKQTYKNVTTPMFNIKHDTCSTVNKNGSTFNLIVKSNNNKTIGYSVKCSFVNTTQPTNWDLERKFKETINF
ncbi:hypothetical protein KQX54_016236 [Cotesia glomerata]|uniref:Uncharacterized protein n=1 Tax=Cotesia glomerata TaxID=32391 RepID=A0AAV7IXC5_COTGL|nr:hypothetical protein KQX54_016236 [Cotesia glomerata]